ncbi:hypothetical protein OXPF_06680 [Oxobacter pfennigii]|uniref:DUF4153 domain-containing protein n=1 Tax=Oxobacter pfennigii TaxID=36849 RepID=A0A0P8X3R1_9CLOT|nr:DUF4153 domain-containing protein [Oxobacter pfennigii]KPU45435.1 hypothetical protein OXPF_06680 [Oxobacter pfennigii]
MKPVEAIKSIIVGLYRSLKRFPVPIIFSAATMVMLIYMNETRPPYQSELRELLTRITMIFALGIPLSLSIKVYLERSSKSIFNLIAYYAGGALLLVLYYFFLLKDVEMVSITRYIAVSLALYLGFLYIPYMLKKEQFEMYIIRIFTGFFTTVIYSIVLYLGLAAILFTVDKLLGIHIQGELYYYTWLFVVFIFSPSYFLAGIPEREVEIPNESYPKLFRILILYIVMPLLTVYTTILYIYFVKIIVTRQWPVGLVSHLVLWYSAIVVIVIFFITPIKNVSKWAERFIVFAPKIILPILIMMFVSMGIRVNAYGLTENRYFVIMLGLWAAGVMLYFSFIKTKRNIIVLLSLSIIAVISVFGPLSSYSLSKASQNKRFEKILIRNNMLNYGQITAAPSNISYEDKNELSRILDYFDENHSLIDVKYLPEGFKTADMNKVFGFEYEGEKPISPEGYFYLSRSQTEAGVDISGYDQMFDSRYLYNSGLNTDYPFKLSYDYATSVLKISKDDKIVYQKELNTFAQGFAGKYFISKDNQVPPEEMTLVEENENVKVKIIFISLSGKTDINTGYTVVNSTEFYVLVKVK